LSAAIRIASMAASRSASVSATLGRTLWSSTTMDGVLSLGLCSSSGTAKDSKSPGLGWSNPDHPGQHRGGSGYVADEHS
jgi:hypothetical protein